MPAFSRFLRYFVAVGRSSSIRRAAEGLNVSASAVDRQLLAAERDLGLPLFERQPSGLMLTAAGEMLMAAALRWQRELDTVRARIDDLKGLRGGHVEIALIDALARGFLPRLIRRVAADYPGITFTLRVLDNDAVQSAVMRGDVDFGIQFGPASSRELSVRATCPVVLGLVVPPDHPLASLGACRLAQTVGYRMVVPAEPLALCRQIAVLQTASDVPLDVACASDNVEMIKSLVRDGVGIGILTSLDVVEEVAAGGIIFLRLTDPVVRPLTLALCQRPARQLSAAANLMLAEIESRFDQIADA